MLCLIFDRGQCSLDDNGRSHHVRAVQDFLRRESVAIPPWPARSSDLNPNEYIWDIIGCRISQWTPPIQTLDEWHCIKRGKFCHKIKFNVWSEAYKKTLRVRHFIEQKLHYALKKNLTFCLKFTICSPYFNFIPFIIDISIYMYIVWSFTVNISRKNMSSYLKKKEKKNDNKE